MAWIELHQSLPTHRKTKKLTRCLGMKVPRDIPQVVGHLAMFWTWAIDNVPDGRLSSIDVQDIADAAGWIRDAKLFFDALREAGFVDDDLRIHDWGLYIGKLIDRRDDNARRNRESRARKRLIGSASRDALDTIAICARDGATVPNPTQPYPTNIVVEEERARARIDHDPQSTPETAPNAFADSPDLPRPDSLEAYISNYVASVMTTAHWQQLDDLLTSGTPDELVRLAIDEACAQGKQSWAYVYSILTRWTTAGIKTVAQARQQQAQFKASKAQSHSRDRPPDRPGGGGQPKFFDGGGDT